MKQPQAQEAGEEHHRLERGDRGLEPGGERALRVGLHVGGLEGLHEAVAVAYVAREHAAQLVHVLALEEHHRKHAALALVALEPVEDPGHESLDAHEGGGIALVEERGVGRVEERERELLAQLQQERVLAAEVVVDGALGDAGLGGDVVERRPGDAVAVEAGEPRLDDRCARERGFLLGPAHGRPFYIRSGTNV